MHLSIGIDGLILKIKMLLAKGYYWIDNIYVVLIALETTIANTDKRTLMPVIKSYIL